jgi:hypothetical protein
MPLEAGQAFRLTGDIMAIEAFEGMTNAIVIPAGNTLWVLSFPCVYDVCMADAIWGERTVMVFEQDLHDRAMRVLAASA